MPSRRGSPSLRSRLSMGCYQPAPWRRWSARRGWDAMAGGCKPAGCLGPMAPASSAWPPCRCAGAFEASNIPRPNKKFRIPEHITASPAQAWRAWSSFAAPGGAARAQVLSWYDTSTHRTGPRCRLAAQTRPAMRSMPAEPWCTEGAAHWHPPVVSGVTPTPGGRRPLRGRHQPSTPGGAA